MKAASQRQLMALQMHASASAAVHAVPAFTATAHWASRQALLPVLLQQTQAGNSQAANSFKHLLMSTSFQPERQWLSVVDWTMVGDCVIGEAMQPNIDWANRYISTMKGRLWCMNHTFATAKCIRDADQQSVYKAVLTIVNDHSQLVAQ